jgi:hypothetical protein
MQQDVSKPRPMTYLLFHLCSKGCTSLALFLLVRKPSMFECIEANKRELTRKLASLVARINWSTEDAFAQGESMNV